MDNTESNVAAGIPDSVTSADNSPEVPDISMTGDGDYDVSAMAEFSAEQSRLEEEGAAEEGVGAVETTGEDSEAYTLDENAQPGDTGVAEQVEESDTGEPVEGDTVTFKVGDKDVHISKDAVFSVKVDGKVEDMPIQDIINRASGVTHIDRENNRISKEKAEFATTREAFNESVDKTNAHVEAMMEINDPYELAEYIAEFKGGDPDEVYNKLLNTTVEHLQKYQNMTETEKELAKENKALKRKERKYEAAEARETKKTEQSTARKELDTSLEGEGYSFEEFQTTLDEIQELVKDGGEAGFDLDSIENPTHDDIIDYMVARDLDNRVTSSIEGIAPKMVEDAEFINKVKLAVLRTESLTGSGKMSQDEVSEFVQQALNLDNKALSESLSKKAKDAKSEDVNSQEEDDDVSFTSVEEYLNSFR